MKTRLLQIIFLFFLIAEMPAQSGVFKWQSEASPPAPCHNPALLVSFRSQGYCGPADRPAIAVQCTNCEGENWNFSVEVRAPGEDWRPLRPDGLPQIAFGNDERVEPLCALPADNYYVRVQAWGVTCATKVTRLLGEPVAIAAAGSRTFAYAQEAPPPVSPSLPETCKVSGQAVLNGALIRGWLMLEAGSPCGELRPYATVTYSHPEYRNQPIEDIPLTPGVKVPFAFELDARDLARSRHPIEVLVYSGMEIAARQVPLAGYWIEAETEQVAVTTPRAASPATAFPAPGTQAAAPAEPMLQETFDTIGVTASDPNCNGIQDLKIVYHPVSPDDPNYITWLSPRCCQEEGCEYAVWIGSDPDRVRLLVKGTKPGAIIREVLQGARPDDTYFEVVVETANGVRKAAFIVGEGPIYGLEEVIAYRDRRKQDFPTSDSLVFVKSPRQPSPPEPYSPPAHGPAGEEPLRYEASNNLWISPDEPASPGIKSEPPGGSPAASDVFQLAEPQVPMVGFSTCRYDRDVILTADREVRVGEAVTIKYDHSREGYRYTLYFQPAGTEEWVLAPGTRELQEKPEFRLLARPYHSGNYLILTYKPAKKWGCLSSTPDAPIKLNVTN